MRLERIEGAEISANRQFIVRDECGGISLARHFGGHKSRSGATVWPAWVQQGALEIKPLACITESDLTDERIVCFSGGGPQFGVRIYNARSESVKAELEKWRRWRRFEQVEPTTTEDVDEDVADNLHPPKRKSPFSSPEDQQFEDEPCVLNDAGWIARAVSYHEFFNTEGARITEHEVSRYATEITVNLDNEAGRFRWTAIMKHGLLVATTLESGGKPGAWRLYRQEWDPQTNFDDFIEEEVIEDENI